MSTKRHPFHPFAGVSIGAKLIVSAAITIGLALVVALTVIVSSRNMDRATRNDHFTDSVIKDVLDLNSLSYEYLLLGDKRPAAQWRLQHASLGRILTEHAVGSNEEQALLERLRSSHEQLKKLFERVSERTVEGREGPSPYDELNEGVTAQLMARAEIMANDASLLGRESARYMGAVQRSSLIFILGSAFLLIVSATATATLLKKDIGGSIRALELGTERIAAGDLDYRLDMRTGDELGDLARSFDTMTERLLTVTVSKDRLQQEIRQREVDGKRAERERAALGHHPFEHRRRRHRHRCDRPHHFHEPRGRRVDRLDTPRGFNETGDGDIQHR